ncbi:MAG: hypothetical protein NTW85_04000 [Methylococcales bacterium]|nr:hypothetical protein [Methylococcales bacterium]
MLFLAKALAIAVLVWFYTTAREKGEPPINWAITGLIGYVIVWIAVRYTVVQALWSMVSKNPTAAVVVMQIPALCAIAGAFLIRKKLISNASEKTN